MHNFQSRLKDFVGDLFSLLFFYHHIVHRWRIRFRKKSLNWTHCQKEEVRFTKVFLMQYQGVIIMRIMQDRVILLSSHTKSPRYMLNSYQDAIAICKQYGHPYLFITFTCNVK
ncbi:hypothetical protein DVH24_001447 [Malus domestica]|uniref:Helitron helicase-like domain-containing protein n=1 Tax=Malus domestica TaxID=3750 RepID=A0A498K697_MALDO|nr:hypothetical protein DVH24_001447 [Malus domestica]